MTTLEKGKEREIWQMTRSIDNKKKKINNVTDIIKNYSNLATDHASNDDFEAAISAKSNVEHWRPILEKLKSELLLLECKFELIKLSL